MCFLVHAKYYTALLGGILRFEGNGPTATWVRFEKKYVLCIWKIFESSLGIQITYSSTREINDFFKENMPDRVIIR